MQKTSNVPPVSVIIPVYNMEKYIVQSINSAQSQTLKNIEIIIVNDGSTDNSFKIAKEIADTDKRIRIINKENAGLASAYNAGLRVAKGKYVYFLDSDDWMEPDCLDVMHNAAEKNKAEVVKAFGFISENGNTSYEKINIPLQKCGKIITNMPDISEFVCGHVAQWSCLYLKSFLNKNNITCPEIPKAMAPDIDFMYHVWCKCKKLYVVNRFFIHYRMDNENSDKNSGDKMSFYLLRGHLVARATMVKLFLPKVYWYIKTRTEFEHFISELMTYRCSTYRWKFIKAVSKIFRENIRHRLVNLRMFRIEDIITYTTIAWFPSIYWINSKLKIYAKTKDRKNKSETIWILGGIYKKTTEQKISKIFLCGKLMAVLKK